MRRRNKSRQILGASASTSEPSGSLDNLTHVELPLFQTRLPEIVQNSTFNVPLQYYVIHPIYLFEDMKDYILPT